MMKRDSEKEEMNKKYSEWMNGGLRININLNATSFLVSSLFVEKSRAFKWTYKAPNLFDTSA